MCAIVLPGQMWQYHWADALSSAETEDEKILVEVDSDDHVYAVGQYRGNLDIGGTLLPVPDDGGRNLFMARYDANGNLDWAAEIAGMGGVGSPGINDLVEKIATDPDNNLYIIGNLGTNATINGQAFGNETNANFVSKISPTGEVLWTVTADADFTNDYFTAIHIDTNGDIYVAGQSGPSGVAWYGLNGVLLNGENTFTDNNPPILAKINADGEVQWVRTIPEPTPANLVKDASGDFYLSAHEGDGGTTSGVYLTRLDGETLEAVWTRHAQHNSDDNNDEDLGLHVKADGTIVHFFKTGTSNPIDFGDGFASDAGWYNRVGLMFHVDADGQTLAMHQLVDQFTEQNTDVNPLAFEVIDDDNFLISGRLTGNIDLANGGSLMPDPWFFGNGAIDPADALVLHVDGELNITAAAYQTGSGRQDAKSLGAFSNGDVAVGGFYLNPENFFGVATTVFGSSELTSSNASANYCVYRVTPGVDEGMSVVENTSIPTQIYPVPASDICYLETSLEGEATVLTIRDLTGKIIRRENIKANGEIRYEIDVQDLVDGIYLLTVENANKSGTQKLVVTR